MDAAAVVEVFDPGGDPGVDLVAGGEGTPVVVLGCEGGPKGFGHGVIPAHCGLPHRHGSFHGAHVGGQLLGGELCAPIGMQHDPCGEGATGGGDRTHTQIHARARQSMADTWRPIGAARHLVFPGHRLIQTPTRQRALAPLGCTVFPRVIARSRDTQDLGHQGNRVGSPCARPSVQSAGVLVHGGEEGAGFSQELVLLLQLAHPPAQCRDLSFHLAWIRTTLTHGLTPLALEFDPPAHHQFTQP